MKYDEYQFQYFYRNILYIGYHSYVCYCEHKNGATPNNGIMCGYKDEVFNINGHCASDEKCTGLTKDDPISKRVPSHRKAELCSKSKGKI